MTSMIVALHRCSINTFFFLDIDGHSALDFDIDFNMMYTVLYIYTLLYLVHI
jgi:hypothetical protein